MLLFVRPRPSVQCFGHGGGDGHLSRVSDSVYSLEKQAGDFGVQDTVPSLAQPLTTLGGGDAVRGRQRGDVGAQRQVCSRIYVIVRTT